MNLFSGIQVLLGGWSTTGLASESLRPRKVRGLEARGTSLANMSPVLLDGRGRLTNSLSSGWLLPFSWWTYQRLCNYLRTWKGWEGSRLSWTSFLHHACFEPSISHHSSNGFLSILGVLEELGFGQFLPINDSSFLPIPSWLPFCRLAELHWHFLEFAPNPPTDYGCTAALPGSCFLWRPAFSGHWLGLWGIEFPSLFSFGSIECM